MITHPGAHSLDNTRQDSGAPVGRVFSGFRPQTLIGDCPPPQDGGQGREVIEKLRANPEIYSSLTYWLSTVSIVKRALAFSTMASRQFM
jgi:hypothetical protein